MFAIIFPGCPETRRAPSAVSNKGLVSKGKVMRIPDSKNMPYECGPIFFSGNTDMTNFAPLKLVPKTGFL